MKPGFGSARGRVWRIRDRADSGVRLALELGGWERRYAIRRVAERDLPIALYSEGERVSEEGMIVFGQQENETWRDDPEKRGLG